MKRIGILVAVEMKAVFDRYEDKLEKASDLPFNVYKLNRRDKTIYIVESGAGQILAASACQHLIDKYKVEAIVNFGVVGALRSELKLKDVYLVDKVVHYDFDTSKVDNIEVGRYLSYPDIYLRTSEEILKLAKEVFPEMRVLTCGSGDKFFDTAEEKTYIRENFNADICDMESAALVLVCDKNKILSFSIKAISDTLDGGEKDYWNTINAASQNCIDIVEKLIDNL